MIKLIYQTCRFCKGTGKIIGQKCNVCKGEGQIPVRAYTKIPGDRK